MTGEEARFIESGIREGVFILLFISVWRAILGPLTSSWAGSGECRAIKGNFNLHFSLMPKDPTIRAHPKSRDWSGVGSGAEGRPRATDLVTVLTSRR